MPALLAKRHVVCDRYLLSSLVYQAVDGLYPAEIVQMNSDVVAPDLTFVLDVSAETHRKRMKERGGSAERFDEQFEVISQRYRSAPGWLPESVIESGKIVLIEADGTPEEVLANVVRTWGGFENR